MQHRGSAYIPSSKRPSHNKSARWHMMHYRACPGRPLWVPDNEIQEHPSSGYPESTHLFSTLILFYLVNISTHARKEVRASHHFKSHQMKVTGSRTAHQGGGCDSASSVHWEEPNTGEESDGWSIWISIHDLISRSATCLPPAADFKMNWQL